MEMDCDRAWCCQPWLTSKLLQQLFQFMPRKCLPGKVAVWFVQRTNPIQLNSTQSNSTQPNLTQLSQLSPTRPNQPTKPNQAPWCSSCPWCHALTPRLRPLQSAKPMRKSRRRRRPRRHATPSRHSWRGATGCGNQTGGMVMIFCLPPVLTNCSFMVL